MPAGRRTKRDVLSEFRTAEILGAARSVFAAKGFADATVDEIAQVAGVAKGTLYLYYKSKRDIYLAALKAGVQTLLDQLRERFATAETVAERIRAFVETRLVYFDQEPAFFRIYYSEFASAAAAAPASHRFVRDMYLEQIGMLADAIRTAPDRDQALRPLDPERVAAVVGELTRGLISDRTLHRGRATVEDEVRFVLDFVWNGLST
ncbi:MAG TPA: TetR/AcrR family transcriptional regulator [Vicinamibacterales bacterium]|jgi:AcrR family transcriptional regulator